MDVKTCKLIVLDNSINSMTEFKQIIGRGTRLYPEYDKNYFTILDFRNASRLFAEPEFDGKPIVIIEGGDGGSGWDPGEENEPIIEGEPDEEPDGETVFIPPDPKTQVLKYYVDDVPVRIINERVQYYDTNGKLITESIRDYSKRNIRQRFASLDEFLTVWTTAEKKQAIVRELEEQGVLLDALREESGKDLDDFDLILHVAFDQKPLTKRERVENVKKRGYLYKYSQECQKVLSALLDKYMDEDIGQVKIPVFWITHLLTAWVALPGSLHYLVAKQTTSRLLESWKKKYSQLFEQ